jgi:hypothetical protein
MTTIPSIEDYARAAAEAYIQSMAEAVEAYEDGRRILCDCEGCLRFVAQMRGAS